MDQYGPNARTHHHKHVYKNGFGNSGNSSVMMGNSIGNNSVNGFNRNSNIRTTLNSLVVAQSSASDDLS